MPQPEDVMNLFEGAGAYLKGHFRLTSGFHSGEYLQSALVLQHPRYAQSLGRQLADNIRSLTAGQRIGLVASPALGGLIIGHEVARALDTPFLFTERAPEGSMTLRRGFQVTPETPAVVIEDVVTTGGSTREVIQLLRSLGAEPLAAGCIIDRSGGTAQFDGVPKTALVTMNVVAYPPEECPLCKQGLPIVKPGSRNTAAA